MTDDLGTKPLTFKDVIIAMSEAELDDAEIYVQDGDGFEFKIETFEILNGTAWICIQSTTDFLVHNSIVTEIE